MNRTTTVSRVLGALAVVWLVPTVITFAVSWRGGPIVSGLLFSMFNGVVLAGPPLLVGGIAWLLLHRRGEVSPRTAAAGGALAGTLWFAAASLVWRHGESSRGVQVLANFTEWLLFAVCGLAMMAAGAVAGLLVWWVAYGTMKKPISADITP